MNFKLRYFLLLIVSVFTIGNIFASKRYWVAASASNWNNTSNWSATSGGSGGSATPTTTDTVYFDGNGNGNCTLDVNITVYRFEMTSGYTGTFEQGAYTITVSPNAIVVNGGTFQGGSADIFAGGFSVNGGIFTSTSSTLSINGNYNFLGGTFNHNNGLIKFRPSGSRTYTGSTTFNNVEINATANASTIGFGANTVFTVNNFSVTGTFQTTLNSTTSFDVKNDVTITNTYGTTSTGLLSLTGTVDQHIYGFVTGSGFNLPAVTINKPSGTLFLHNYIPISAGLEHISGTVDPGTSTIGFTWTQTISGTFTANNLNFAGNLNFIYTLTGANITANGNVFIGYGASSGYCRMLGGTIHVKGNVTTSNTTNTYHVGGTQTNLILDGTGNQTITGSTTQATSYFPSFTINKASGTLFLVNAISVNGDWIYQQGTIDQGTSTIVFGGTQTITGTQTIHKVNFTTGTQTISAGTTITVDDLLTISGGVVNTGNISATGNIAIANNAVSGGGNAVLTINGTGDQTITGNTTIGWSKMPSVVINKASGTLTLTNNVSVGANFTYTTGTVDYGTSTVGFCGTGTITGSQTLNNLTIYAAANITVTIAAGTNITVAGLLKTSGVGALTINTGTLHAQGDIMIANTSTSTSAGGSAMILINGTGNQTLTGSGTAGAGYLPNIEINKPANSTLTFSSIISCSRNWTYIEGNVDAVTNGSQVVFIGNYNLDGEGTTRNMPFNKIVFGANTRTLTGNLDVRSTFNIQNNATLAAGAYNINVGGDWKQIGSNSIFTSSTGTVTFDGGDYVQIVRNSGATQAVFPNLTVNKTGGSIKLNSSVKVTNAFTLTQGKVKAIVDVIGSYFLEIADNVIVTGGSDTAYVHGTIRKTGNDTIIFPLGDTTLTTGAYHPLKISAPASVTDQFEARYYATGQTLGNDLEQDLENLSTCEYWTLNRTVGTSTVTPSISWNSNWCNSNRDYWDLRVAKWNSGNSKWTNFGNSSYLITGANSGIITAGSAISENLTTMTLSSLNTNKPWATLDYKPSGKFHIVEGNYIRFKYFEEYLDSDNKLDVKVYQLIDNKVVFNSANNQISVNHGDNRIKIDLTLFTGGPNPGFYLLEVTNEKSEKFYLKFLIENS